MEVEKFVLCLVLPSKIHCVKLVCIRNYFGPHLSASGLDTERYGVRMRKNADQNNSEYFFYLLYLLIFILCWFAHSKN